MNDIYEMLCESSEKKEVTFLTETSERRQHVNNVFEGVDNAWLLTALQDSNFNP